jgi:hypothetical protein
MLMGYREYARHRRVSLGAVQKAINAGRISVTEDKKIDSEIADKAWELNTDQSRIAMNVLDNAPRSTALLTQQKQMELDPAADDTECGIEQDEDIEAEALKGADRVASEYREHRSTRERYQALKQQLEYEQLVGTLINVEDAKRIAYTSFRALRDVMLNVAPRIKDQLAATSDPLLCEQLLERELSSALASIDIGKLLKEQEE